MAKKLLLTGASGFIGRNLIPFLEKSDTEIFILDKNAAAGCVENIHFIACNLHDHDAVRKILRSLQATHLLHVAWGMYPGNYNHPDNFNWTQSSIFLLEEFVRNKGERVIMTGSCVEYDWSYGKCIENKTPIVHDTLYGASKNVLREYSTSFCNHHGIEFVWPRIFFLYGPHEPSQRLIAHVISSLLKGNTAIITNGDLYRDYVYVKECARVLADLVFHPITGTINIGTGIPVKIADIGKIAAEIIGRPELLQIQSPETLHNRVVFADVSNLTEKLSYAPSNDILTGLKETISWWSQTIITEKNAIEGAQIN
jgi:UDP-glucuronate decarboxylase